MTPRLRTLALAGAALAAAPVAALGAKAPAAKARPAIYTVTIKDMKFSPPPASIHVGDTIAWVNDDIFLHSATAKNGAFDAELKPGARLWTTFLKPGTYAFVCRYHPGMTGTLVVTEKGR